jgi:putative ABC transport system permease protein
VGGALEALYRVALLALPGEFRARYRSELIRVFRERVSEVRERGDARTPARTIGALRRASSECLDAVTTGYRLRSAQRGVFPSELTWALRALRRRPTFTLAAAGTLAVGIGSVTAIFAVVDAVLLRPLPYREPERLVMVWRTIERFGFERAPSSLPDLRDWSAGASGFEALAAYTGASATLHGEGGPERLTGARVSGDLFSTLGAPLHRGRGIASADDAPDAEPVVVLSHGLWQRRFGGSDAVVGRTVQLGDAAVRVIGVTRPGFDFPNAQVEFWRPLALAPEGSPRDQNFLQVIGRLRAEVSLEAAEADLRAVAERVRQAYPGESVLDDVWLEPRHAFVVGDVRSTLLVLGGAVLLLFALACVNLANLLLVRGVGRRGELAVRAALGAPAARLRTPLLAESLLLSAIGGAAGLLLAWGLTRALPVLEPGVLPRRGEVGIDGRVALFTTAASLLCALACGWLPAWSIGRSAPGEALHDRTRHAPGMRAGRLQSALVVVQVAAAALLAVGAALLGRSFHSLVTVATGFEPRGVFTAQVPLPPARYPGPADVAAFYETLMERLRRHPGVEAVGGTWALPFSADYASSMMLPEGGAADAARTVSLAPVRGDYFRAAGMTLVAGRAPGPEDARDTPSVAVVTRALAELFWPAEDPIGKRLVSADGDDGESMTVIGVVADVKRRALDEPDALEAYVPQSQAPWARDLSLVVRTSGDAAALAAALRQEVWALDRTLPITRASTLSERIRDSVAAPRFRSSILVVLATAATLLAAVGVYGVLSYAISERRRDTAVRFALGAGRGRIAREVVGRAARLTAVGLAFGLLGAAAGARTLRAFLFQVDPLDPLAFGGAAALLCLVTLAAAWLPARRAASADPAAVLKSE